MATQTYSLNETESIAKQIIDFAGKKKIILLFGEPGAGKTTLVQSICKLLGYTQNVTSPTFTLLNEYKISNDDYIYHFDFYRMTNPNEALTIGFFEYIDSGNLCIIEWPELLLNELQKEEHVKVYLKHSEDTKRTIEMR